VGVTGTIAMPPDFAQQLVLDEASWVQWHRWAWSPNGWHEFYWVVFDEPQMKLDGYGPYPEGEVLADVLTLVAAEGSSAMDGP
jgi:hypothetical protein